MKKYRILLLIIPVGLLIVWILLRMNDFGTLYDNTTPEIALHETRSALEQKGITVGDASFAPDQAQCDVQLYALPRLTTSTWFAL